MASQFMALLAERVHETWTRKLPSFTCYSVEKEVGWLRWAAENPSTVGKHLKLVLGGQTEQPKNVVCRVQEVGSIDIAASISAALDKELDGGLCVVR